MYMHVCIHIYTEVVDRIAQLSAIASHICRRSLSPISDRFAVPCAHTRVMLSLTHVHRQILVHNGEILVHRISGGNGDPAAGHAEVDWFEKSVL